VAGIPDRPKLAEPAALELLWLWLLGLDQPIPLAPTPPWRASLAFPSAFFVSVPLLLLPLVLD
jgi:hypothetical protein